MPGLKQKEKEWWVAVRNEEICGAFESRREAVKWLKGLLKQTLKDFDKQDSTDEYDYPIDIKGITIKKIHKREEYLAL